MVCDRVYELEAGIILKNNSIEDIKKSTLEVLSNYKYKENAMKLSESFQNSGGAEKASDIILGIIDKNIRNYSKIT